MDVIEVICDICGEGNCNHMTLATIKTFETETDTQNDDQTQSDHANANNISTFEELLIANVEVKPILWNSKLKLSQRGKPEKDKAWLEIAEFFDKKYSIPYLQKKWKNLRDQFVKVKGEEEVYVPSGSGVESKKKRTWKHYESMKFLKDCLAPRATITNITPVQDTLTVSTSTTPEPQTPKGTKRQREREDSASIIVEAIKNLPPPPIAISPTNINPICQRLSEMLGTLNQEDCLDLEIQLLQLAKKFIFEKKTQINDF
ncbi:uncharacterized protein LOC115880711 [Sitophilus oryzae]|uniref:Uncharacterized protein LOC115880711 n=1 Tax=Sitophilus oryzae TaxID=7048 RepID=A0A6J2XTE4_SITOR|nr:uncharacterized protein LOC115880711 [Sitophilus oryzae]